GDIGSATTQIVVANVDRPPTVVAPPLVRGRVDREIVVEVTAADPDGDPLSTLDADRTGLPAGAAAQFVPNPTNTGGTFRWTPRAGESGNFTVAFTAANAAVAVATTSLEVRRTPDSPSAPGGENDPIPSVLDLSLGFPNPAVREITFALDLPQDSPVA